MIRNDDELGRAYMHVVASAVLTTAICLIAVSEPAASAAERVTARGLDSDIVTVDVGTMASVGAFRIGCRNVFRDEENRGAVVSFTPRDQRMVDVNDYGVLLTVRPGDMFPLDGDLFEVIDIRHRRAATQRSDPSGRTRSNITIQRVERGAVKSPAGNLAIPVTGIATLHGTQIEVRRVETDARQVPVAAVDLWPWGSGGKEMLKAEDPNAVRHALVREGDLLKVGPHRHNVVRIVLPDGEKRRLGWIELQIAPHFDLHKQ